MVNDASRAGIIARLFVHPSGDRSNFARGSCGESSGMLPPEWNTPLFDAACAGIDLRFHSAEVPLLRDHNWRSL
jgi:hypothetical protein